MKTTYRWIPYYRKRLNAVAALDYFRTAKRLHKFTGIALTSIYHARDYGYFYDQGHIHIIEHCTGDKVKGELIPEESERRVINEAYARSWRATEGWRKLKVYRQAMARRRAEWLELTEDESLADELMDGMKQPPPDLLKRLFPALSAPFLTIKAYEDLPEQDKQTLLSVLKKNSYKY